MFVKVTDSNFIRDTSSMGLSNINIRERNEYYLKVKAAKAQKEEINTLRTEIDSIKNDISDIKNLMIKLLEKG